MLSYLATGRKEYNMKKRLFDSLIRKLQSLPKCDIPSAATLQELSLQMTFEQIHSYAKLLVDKGAAEYYYGRIRLRNGYLLT
jgi:hypothetical protein